MTWPWSTIISIQSESQQDHSSDWNILLNMTQSISWWRSKFLQCFFLICCNVVSKDSDVVTITMSPVFVNRGCTRCIVDAWWRSLMCTEDAPDVLLMHGGGHWCVQWMHQMYCWCMVEVTDVYSGCTWLSQNTPFRFNIAMTKTIHVVGKLGRVDPRYPGVTEGSRQIHFVWNIYTNWQECVCHTPCLSKLEITDCVWQSGHWSLRDLLWQLLMWLKPSKANFVKG